MSAKVFCRIFLLFVFMASRGSSAAQMMPVDGGLFSRWFPWEDQTLQMGSFLISKFEVTWGEWQNVRSAATSLGYDLSAAGTGLGANYPVQGVNWYDVLKWCNARSELEGLRPVYWVASGPFRAGEVTPSVDASSTGYRLPTEAEWEWAARGGKFSKGFEFSGSNNAEDVSWFWYNAAGVPRVVGAKIPNELGLYDMSGNVNEWCWDIYASDPRFRFIRGGSAYGLPGYGALFYFGLSQAPESRWEQTGFRPVRTAVSAPPPTPAPAPTATPTPTASHAVPVFQVASSSTTRRSSYILRLTASTESVSGFYYRLRKPGSLKFGNWTNQGTRRSDDREWNVNLKLAIRGKWQIQVRSFYASGNAGEVHTVTVRRR